MDGEKKEETFLRPFYNVLLSSSIWLNMLIRLYMLYTLPLEIMACLVG